MEKKIWSLGLILLLILSLGCLAGERAAETPMPQQTTGVTQAPATTPPQTTKPPSIISPNLGNIYEAISVQKLKEKIEKDEDFILLDVRSKEEFDEGYIPGAILILYTEVEDRHEELNAPKDKEIVVYCKAGVRSKNAANKLTELGYTNVRELDAGIDGWLKDGGEIERPAPITTEPPTTEPPWTTEPATTTTVPPSTTAPPEKILWTEKLSAVYQFEGSKTFEMDHDETVQGGGALIYMEYSVEGISGSCFPIPAWFLSIFKATAGGGVWEDTLAYSMDNVKTPQDITDDVHQRTDALDDYTIVVEDWPQEKMVLTLTRQK